MPVISPQGAQGIASSVGNQAGGGSMGFFDMGFSDALGFGGDIFSSIGQKRAADKDRAARQKQLDTANRTAEENFARSEEFTNMVRGMFGEGGDYASLLTDPIKSSTVGSESYSSQVDPTFTAQGQTSLNNMLTNAMNEQARAESLPEFAGMEEGMARDYGNEMSSLKTALGNRAAGRGAAPLDTDLEGILAGRGITSDFLGKKQNVPMMKEQARMGKNQIANMLFGNIAGLTKGSKTKGRASRQSTTEQGQGAGAMMGYAEMLRPRDKTVYV